MNRLIAVLLALLSIGWTNAPVRELKLSKSSNEAAIYFDSTVNVAGITNGVGSFLKTTVETAAAKAAKDGKNPQSLGSMRGRWLEWATFVALKQHGVLPAYSQAEFAAVPHNYNDVLLWSKEHGPIVISCKTSLRERYKQADLEAVALRQHYPDAKFFLLTLDEDKRHVVSIRKKIDGKELLALHALYDETDADHLFSFLKTLTLIQAPDKVLRSGTIVGQPPRLP